MIRAEALVHGRVQGVGFRAFAARSAAGLGVTGWVANESGGTVRCVAEGPVDAVEAFLRAIADGPIGADVRSLDVVRGPAAGGFTRFEIRSGWHGGD